MSILYLETDLGTLMTQHVPTVGRSPSHGSECIRAMNYMISRFNEYNEFFNICEGSINVGPIATFLFDCTNKEIHHIIGDQSIIYTEDKSQYQTFLETLTNTVIPYAISNLDVEYKGGMGDVGNVFFDDGNHCLMQ